MDKTETVVMAQKLFEEDLVGIEDVFQLMQNLFGATLRNRIRKSTEKEIAEVRAVIETLSRGEITEDIVALATKTCEKWVVRVLTCNTAGRVTDDGRERSQKWLEVTSQLEQFLPLNHRKE